VARASRQALAEYGVLDGQVDSAVPKNALTQQPGCTVAERDDTVLREMLARPEADPRVSAHQRPNLVWVGRIQLPLAAQRFNHTWAGSRKQSLTRIYAQATDAREHAGPAKARPSQQGEHGHALEAGQEGFTEQPTESAKCGQAFIDLRARRIDK
jgi:hypothetical protein